MPDHGLAWLDAAYVLTSDGPKYPPLLGTGGNDGRLDFTNNYMQHLLTLFVGDGSATANSERLLRESLFRELSDCRHRGTIGQFDPGNLGGANNGSGFDGYSTVNSWDFILMLEGAILFAAASAKRLESGDGAALAYPFVCEHRALAMEALPCRTRNHQGRDVVASLASTDELQSFIGVAI